jgi:type IV pilus assembly protein PilF
MKISVTLQSGFLLGFILTASLMSGCTGEVKKAEASDYNSELGIRYLQKGRLQLANEKLSKSLKQNPNSVQSNHYYAILQQRLGKNKEASSHFLKAIRLDSKNPELRNNYGSFLCETNRPQAAVKQFLIAVKDPLYKTPAYAYSNAGTCLKKVNNPAQAEKYFREALKKKHAFPSALLGMAGLYSDRRNYSKAQAFMLRYETVGKSTPEALKLCVIINTKMNNYSKADSCRSALLRLFPSSPEAAQVNKSL